MVFLAVQLYDLATAGRIGVALVVGSSPAVVTSALNNTWAPIVYRAPEHERGAVLAHTALDIATLAALISGGVALLSPWLMRLAAGESFAPLQLVPAVAIVAFGCVVSVAYLANVHLVFAVGRSLGLSVITPLSLVAGLAAAYLAGRQDLVLLTVGFPATYVALAIGTAWLRRHVGGAAWNEISLLPPVGIGLVLCALGALLPTSGTSALLRLAAAAIAGLGAIWLARRVLGR
jgi:hypothetical protein